MLKTALFDVETGPRPDAELVGLLPEFTAPKNYKDQGKISEYIAGERAAWMERAALSAVTGRVIAIGLRREGQTQILDAESEADQLKAFWSIAEDCVRERRALVGFNINRFDLPFLTRRSWHYGITPPDGLFSARGYPSPELFVDLAVEWACGDRQEFIKLDVLAKFLGVGEKNGEGKHFATLWATERRLAIAYLENDLVLAARIMERLMGISEISAPPPAARTAQSGNLGREIPATQATTAAPPTAPSPAPVPAGTIDDY